MKQLSRRKNWIEPRIQPLVEGLNTSGFRTHYSCGGHFFRDRQAWVVFESDIETAYRLWLELQFESEKLRLFWTVTPWPRVAPHTFRILSGNYSSWKYFTDHLSSDIKELTKKLGMLRHHENSQQNEEQSRQNMPFAVDQGSARILRPASAVRQTQTGASGATPFPHRWHITSRPIPTPPFRNTTRYCKRLREGLSTLFPRWKKLSKS